MGTSGACCCAQLSRVGQRVKGCFFLKKKSLPAAKGWVSTGACCAPQMSRVCLTSLRAVRRPHHKTHPVPRRQKKKDQKKEGEKKEKLEKS